MWGYVAHTDSLFDPDQLAEYIRAYETRKPLTLGELWAAAITLRLLLLENLRRIAEQVVSAANDRARADAIADTLLGTGGRQRLTLAEAVPNRSTVRMSRAFVVQFLRRLAHTDETDGVEWASDWIETTGQDIDDLTDAEHQQLSRQAVTIRNIFTSMRLVSDVNWEDWIESVSLLERELSTNPGYPGLDFTTRNSYRSAIESLARGSNKNELEVARAALVWSRDASDEVGRDLGFWLIDDGRRTRLDRPRPAPVPADELPRSRPGQPSLGQLLQRPAPACPVPRDRHTRRSPHHRGHPHDAHLTRRREGTDPGSRGALSRQHVRRALFRRHHRLG